jgi:methionyl-tRNA synthetase
VGRGKSYFFKLSAYQDKLLALYENQPDFIGRIRARTRSSASSKAA